MKTTECINCSNSFTGNFCPQCGEKVYEQRISFSTFMDSLVSGITNADKGVLHNLKYLTIAPRQTIIGYLNGKRKNVFNPVSYAILTTTIYLILASLISLNTFDALAAEYNKTPFYEFGQNTGKFLKQNLKYFWLLNIVVLSFFTKLFFRTYNFVEHLTINAFILGHVTIIGAATFWLYRISFNPLVWLSMFIMMYFIFRKPNEKIEKLLLSFLAVGLTVILFYVVPMLILLSLSH